MIIARLLTPKEIGIFSVGASLIGIAHTLRDFGVSNYLIQVKDLSTDKIKSAFSLTALMAWLIAAILFFTKTIIADFYNQPELTNVVQIMALSFIILPFSSITIALLKRDMKFGEIYKITVIAACIQAITTITMAWLGYGFYSLAWGGFANVLATTILAQIVMPSFSNFRFSLKNCKPIFSFGGKLSITSLAYETGNYAPDLIIGKLLGFAPAGFYSRALGFVNIIEHTLTDAIRPVMLPYFSKQYREKGDIKEVFLKIANYYLAVTLPLLCLIALLAYPMIRLLYGSQWDAAIPIAQILCLAMAFKSLNFLTASAILAKGNAGKIMKAQLSYQCLRIIAILYGALESLEAIARNLVIVECIGFFIFYSQLRETKLNLFQLLSIVFKNLLLALLSTIPALLIYLLLINRLPIDYNNTLTLIKEYDYSTLNMENISFYPKETNELDNLKLILTISSIMFFSWLINIYLSQKEIWATIVKSLNFHTQNEEKTNKQNI
jgi:O-antigen/teichoic acid export membrane protein